MKRRHFTTAVTNFAIITILGVLFVTTVFTTSTSAFKQANDAVYYGNRESGKVSLMFNVYQGEEYIPDIMKTLSDYGYSATFFVGGIWAEKHGDLIKDMAKNGFEVANHGYLHKDCSSLSAERIREEIIITEKLISSYTGSTVKLFAPPSGDLSDSLFKVAKTEGYKVIMWTTDTIDWRDKNADTVYSRATKNLKAGDLVLMHPTAHTLEALPKILEYIKNASLACDTVTNTISG